MDVTTATAAICAAAAVLVIVAGLAKLVTPEPAGAVLAALLAATLPRVPRRPAVLRPTARLVGVAEVAVGALVIVLGGRVPAILLAVAYAAFATVALWLSRGDRAVACGCFGKSDTPVSASHVVVTSLAAAVAATGAVVGVDRWGGVLGDGPALAIGGPILIGALAWCAFLSLTALPALSVARRPVEAS